MNAEERSDYGSAEDLHTKEGSEIFILEDIEHSGVTELGASIIENLPSETAWDFIMNYPTGDITTEQALEDLRRAGYRVILY